MSRKIVLVVNDIRDCGSSYYVPFESFGRFEGNSDILKEKPRDVALVVFTGGADVDPSIYNENRSRNCGYSNIERDNHEKQVFEWAKSLKIPMAGICRGSQLLCALNGGSLFQHVTGHHGSHPMITHDGRKMKVSSTHHQMANPTDLVKNGQAKILAWAYPKLSERYETGNSYPVRVDMESEVVYYSESNSIGFQYHPEIMAKDSEGFKYTIEMCIKHLGVEPDKE